MSEDCYRLSPLQERLFRAHHGVPGRAVCVLEADRPLDRTILLAALRRLAARHAILRTTYPKLPSLEVPVQRISAEAEVELTETELADAAALQGWVAAQLAGGDRVELAAPPALRATLARVGGDRGGCCLALSLPAIAADPRTLRVLGEELGALLRGEAPEPDEAFEYLDFSEWHHELLADEADEGAREGRRYWRRILEPPPGVRPLPGELDSGAGYPGSDRRPLALPVLLPVPLPPGLAACHRRRAAGVELSDLLLAGWAAFLARVAGESEVLVSWLEEGRGHELLTRAAGLFARHLPLRLRIDPRLSLDQLAERIAGERATAAEHGDAFAPPATGSASTAGFRYEEWPPEIAAGGTTLRPRGWYAPLDPCRVELVVGRVGNDLHAEILCDPRQLPAAAAHYLARLAATALAAAVTAPESRCGELPILPAAERHFLVRECNDTAGPTFLTGAPVTVPALFARRVATDPSAPAVVAAGEELTFAELDARANRLAWELRRRGVGPEVVVGLCLERSPELIVALLAILKAGGAYLPLDPFYPVERWRSMLRAAGARLVVSRRRLLDPLGELGGGEHGEVQTLCLDEAAGVITAHPAEPLPGGAAPGNLAYVLFTSGSTGRPKGVMIEHRALVNLATALEERIYRRLGAGPLRVGLNAPLVFDASVKQWIQLLAGHALCLVPEEVRPDPARFLAYAEATRLDLVDGTPSQVARLLDAGLGSRDSAGPRTVLIGGEAIDGTLWRRLGECPGVRFWNLYGPTECTVDATAAAIGQGPPRLGWLLRNVRADLCDRRGRVVPRAADGELFLGGAGVGRGYAAAPRTTAERYVPDPYGSVGARLYRTGDRVRRSASGELEFLGRIDRQVKVRGFRIELGEIEAVLGEHPAVREAAADLRPLGEDGEQHLIAWVATTGGKDAHLGHLGDLAGELRSHLRARLPEFMVPAYIVELERLPLNRNGKVDRRALPLPADVEHQRHAEFLAPRNRLEVEIAEIWQRILGVEKVGANDNFFDLGGHSLLLLQTFEALRERFDGELTMVEMFNHPTVATLAERLGREQPQPVLAGVQDRVEKQRLARERQRQAMKKPGDGA